MFAQASWLMSWYGRVRVDYGERVRRSTESRRDPRRDRDISNYEKNSLRPEYGFSHFGTPITSGVRLSRISTAYCITRARYTVRAFTTPVSDLSMLGIRQMYK